MKYLKKYNEIKQKSINWGNPETNIGVLIKNNPDQFQTVLMNLGYKWIIGENIFNSAVPSNVDVIYVIKDDEFFWLRVVEELEKVKGQYVLEKNIMSEREFLIKHNMEEWIDAKTLGLY